MGDKRILWGIYGRMILEFLAPGILLSAAGLIIVGIRNAKVIGYMWLFCGYFLLMILAVAVLRASVIMGIAYYRFRKEQKRDKQEV